VQVGRTHTVSSLGLLAKGVVGLPGRTHHLHHAHHKNRHFYFLQPSLVLVETHSSQSPSCQGIILYYPSALIKSSLLRLIIIVLGFMFVRVV